MSTCTLLRWEETLLIDEALERLVALDALVILEVRGMSLHCPHLSHISPTPQVLQPAINLRRLEKHSSEYKGGMHRVAWAFLKLQVGEDWFASRPFLLKDTGDCLLPSPPLMISHLLCHQGPSGAPLTGRLQLQLYDYHSPFTLGLGARPPQGASHQAPSEAYASWKVSQEPHHCSPIIHTSLPYHRR